jgi:hypothetical protein
LPVDLTSLAIELLSETAAWTEVVSNGAQKVRFNGAPYTARLVIKSTLTAVE